MKTLPSKVSYNKEDFERLQEEFAQKDKEIEKLRTQLKQMDGVRILLEKLNDVKGITFHNFHIPENDQFEVQAQYRSSMVDPGWEIGIIIKDNERGR